MCGKDFVGSVFEFRIAVRFYLVEVGAGELEDGSGDRFFDGVG